MTLSLVVAVSRNGVIGSQGALPWHLSDDLKRFKALTMGHPIVMGRKTFDSIGRALPGRTNIVITRGDAALPDGVQRARSLDDALTLAARAPGGEHVFVIGGGEIYAQALQRADRIYFTRVACEVQGDVHFPALDARAWRELSRESFAADDKNDYATERIVLERDR